MSFVRVSGATDFVLIILHFSPEHTQSAHYNPHSIDTHCLVHPCALIAQMHTCASESNVALVTSALEGVILGLLARQPSAAQRRHAHTSHLPQHIASSRSPPPGFFTLKSSLPLFYRTSVSLNLSPCVYFAFSLPVLSVPRSRARPRLPLLACRSEVTAERMF